MNIVTVPLDRWIGHSPEYKYNERSGSIKYIVLHTTGGTNSIDWLSLWNRKQETAQNNVSIHYLVQRDGAIYRIIDDAKRAWHVGTSKMPDGETDGNGVSIGIEIEHLNEPDYTDTQLNSTAELVHSLMEQYKIAGNHVVSHASVATPAGRKIDPVHFDWAGFWDRVATFDNKTQLPKSQEPISAPTAALPYSHLSFTVARPQIDAGKLVEYLAHKHNYVQYRDAGADPLISVRSIFNTYVKYGTETGIDYVFAIAQMIHETGWLESWWSGRPRRNPAGIGVTGQTSVKNPNDAVNWVKSGNIWMKGQSFKSWDISVQHHLARLLLYAMHDEEMTPEQLAFSNICPDRARLARIRGVAKQWVGFNGVWAVPGRTYAQKLAEIANSFVTASQ